jgi:hypothetical protein
MAGNESGEAIFSGGGIPYVDAATKDKLATEQAKLAVVGAVAIERNQFGDDDTVFFVKSKALEDGEHKLALSATEARQRQAKACLDRFAAGASSIGPLYLSWESFKGGKSGWVLQAEPGVGQGDDKPTAGVASDGGADLGDDGIPY